MQLGYTRQKKGEVRGDITALMTRIARALPSKTADEIEAFLLARDTAPKS